MIPRKANEHIEKSAEQQHIPEEDLSIMVNEYWKSLKEQMVDPEHYCISVIGMGKMRMSSGALAGRIKDIEEDETLSPTQRKNRLLPWQILQDNLHDEWEREKLARDIKNEFKRKKKNNESKRDIEIGLGEQESDS